MSEEFIIEVMPDDNSDDEFKFKTDDFSYPNKYMVKQKSTGWFYPNLTKIQAEALCEKFNELISKPLDLHTDFTEWNNLINRLDKNTRRLVEIEETYQLESDRILSEAREQEVDFKALYGGNNATTRKQYVDEQLTDLLEEKKELEFVKADDNRRISFLKKLIDMKINLIKYGVDE